MKTNDYYRKYGIDNSRIKSFEEKSISMETLQKMQNMANRFLPIVCYVEFQNLINDVNNQNYAAVYSSDVFKTIIGLCQNKNLTSLNRGEFLYRARIIDEEDIYTQSKGIAFSRGRLKGYDWINSKEPPIGLSPKGRANSENSSYFYCSAEGNTAVSEIKAGIGDFVSLASFRTKRQLRIVDLSNATMSLENSKANNYMQLLIQRFSKPIKDINEYRFTQFISDEIRKCGVDGICYTSYFTQATNYVIFNCSATSMRFVESRILKLHAQQLFFVDYSTEAMLATKAPSRLSGEKILKEKTKIYNLIKLHSDFKKELEDTHNG